MTSWRDRLPIDEVNERRINIYLKDLENEDVDGLKEIISSLEHGRASGIYEELKNAFDSRNQFYPHGNLINYKNMSENSVYILANQNMSKFYLNNLRSSVITSMYKIFEFRYSMTTKRESNEEDIKNVYLSGLDERLIYGLDRFNEITNWPQPKADFFQKLNEVTWEKGPLKLAEKLVRLKKRIEYNMFGFIKYERLDLMETGLIELIAGCSAVNNGRNITKKDIIIAFRTYLKLLNTDITKYKARTILNNGNVDMGYLVCDKCNEYYKLQPGESPEDFSDKCECGGKLKYYKDIEWLIK